MPRITAKQYRQKHSREKDIQKEILDYLNRQPSSGFFWRQNTGAFKAEYKGKTRLVRFGIPGAADITGIRHGRRIEIEVKVPGKEPSPTQGHFRDLIERAGGIYIVATCLEDVKERGL